MIRKLLYINLVVFFIFSCSSKHYFKDYVSIPDNVWREQEVVRFNVPIDDTSSLYNISLNVRHGYNYQYKNLWIFSRITSPDGHYVIDTLDCILQANDNSWRGKCLGDICDMQITFADSVKFRVAGNYIFEFRHGLRIDAVPYILEIGLLVDKLNSKN